MTHAVISELWQYPVKSMGGSRIARTCVGATSVEGDRVFVVHDTRDGAPLTATRVPELLSWTAGWTAERELQLIAPDGTAAEGWSSNAVGALIRERLGSNVGLRRSSTADRRGDAPLHLLTTASLRTLRLSSSEVSWDVRRFRPNVVLNVRETGFVEDQWVGRSVVIDDVVLRVTRRADRCTIVTHAQPDLDRDPRVLRQLRLMNELHVGVYCDVVATGAIEAGAAVRVDRSEERGN